MVGQKKRWLGFKPNQMDFRPSAENVSAGGPRSSWGAKSIQKHAFDTERELLPHECLYTVGLSLGSLRRRVPRSGLSIMHDVSVAVSSVRLSSELCRYSTCTGCRKITTNMKAPKAGPGEQADVWSGREFGERVYVVEKNNSCE